MADEVLTVIYHVYFASLSDAERAMDSLVKFGFSVEREDGQAPTQAPFGVLATMRPVSEQDAAKELDRGLRGIPYDRLIHWHAPLLRAFTE